MDGGVRQNTPIAPALRLGATHVFSIGLSREVAGQANLREDEKMPGAAFMVGKILNAFLLDHIQTDLEVMNRMNHIIEDAEKIYGPEFLSKVNGMADRRGAMPYSRTRSLVVRPSDDIGRLAAEYVRGGNMRGSAAVMRRLLTLVDVGEGNEADLASYLLFDGAFARRLIDLGRADAEARKHEIAEFFGHAAEDETPVEAESAEWSIPPYVE
jgi:NTE family protein